MIAGIEEQGQIGSQDQLTGLCSRYCFLTRVKQLDLKKYLPISFITGDINDLKLINDIFGYNKGDNVIRSVAEIFKNNCQKDGVVARWGEDEFVVALPNTDRNLSLKILDTIKTECGWLNSVPIKPTVALGTATKDHTGQDIIEILKKAEAEVCQNKILEARNVRDATIASLVKQLGKKDYETEEHAWRMQSLAIQFGSDLRLTDDQMDDLILTVTLHDIGKLAVPDHILMKSGGLTSAEWEIIKKHSERGYRIALSSSKLSHIAPAILAHHERWDGKGYPLGLTGMEIPLLSRIVAIVDSYDVMTNERPYKKAINKETTLQELRRSAGHQFDPDLIKIFLEMDFKI